MNFNAQYLLKQLSALGRTARHMRTNDAHSRQSTRRIRVIATLFVLGYILIAIKMSLVATSAAQEPITLTHTRQLSAQRADIVDRSGILIATNITAHAAYAHPRQIVDREEVAAALASIFPEKSMDAWHKTLDPKSAFAWVKTRISPRQMQALHDIGDPGLHFAPREIRFYPNGALAAHVIGGTTFGAQDVNAAELKPVAGIERNLDARLRDPAQVGTPLVLSLDLRVQSAVEEILSGAMQALRSKGAAAIVMDAHSGAILALASLPDFDPNNRPPPAVGAQAGAQSPLFNRAVQGSYELGSTYKIFTAANALEAGHVMPDTKVDANAPLRWGRHSIQEYRRRNYGPLLSVTDVMVKSSNVGTANMALKLGKDAQQAFFKALGLMETAPIELPEAAGGRPQLPPEWKDISTITTSYGHGMTASPLHLAAAYASIANGGRKVTPTLLYKDTPPPMPQIMRPDTAQAAVEMLRQVVVRGTARGADVPGYEVAGKTGTADIAEGGAYQENRNINTFAAIFPASKPAYVVVVTLFEPQNIAGEDGDSAATAGQTAVPVAASIITRIAPLLGLRPAPSPDKAAGETEPQN